MNKIIKSRYIWLTIHWVIIINFLMQIFYGMAQVFFVLIPEGGSAGPLWGSSVEIPFELMLSRRLYAIETWVAIAGLAIYLAIIYGRKLKGEVEDKA